MKDTLENEFLLACYEETAQLVCPFSWLPSQITTPTWFDLAPPPDPDLAFPRICWLWIIPLGWQHMADPLQRPGNLGPGPSNSFPLNRVPNPACFCGTTQRLIVDLRLSDDMAISLMACKHCAAHQSIFCTMGNELWFSSVWSKPFRRPDTVPCGLPIEKWLPQICPWMKDSTSSILPLWYISLWLSYQPRGKRPFHVPSNYAKCTSIYHAWHYLFFRKKNWTALYRHKGTSLIKTLFASLQWSRNYDSMGCPNKVW